MEQVLRLNSTDQRITYNSNWRRRESETGEGQNGTYSLTTSAGAELYFLFRGTYNFTTNGPATCFSPS
jgi:hypothetical protein